jgi:three-Cys-motif partner protein
MPTDFFAEPADQSLVKAEIVVNYFQAWSRIMARRAERIGYWDFYAGPGRYASGEKSVPLLILEKAIAEPDLRSRLMSMFNDGDPSMATSLESEIKALPGIETLKYAPQVVNSEVGDEIVEQFEKIRTIPALSFIDPWGYKGLSLRLIRSVIKDWGCEVVFFFNYNRINMGISNPIVKDHMEALLGTERLGVLIKACSVMLPQQREAAIHRALGDALEEMGAPYLIPFRFKRAGGRVSHYICFVSKHKLGYQIMKEIMASRGVVDADGVPQFEYLPTAAGQQLTLPRFSGQFVSWTIMPQRPLRCTAVRRRPG